MLEDSLKKALADMFSFYVKSWGFHWNVEGPSFPSLHALFGTIYKETGEAIDDLAEHIRTLDIYAPGSMERFKQLSVIEEQLKIPRAAIMVRELLHDNEVVIHSLREAFNVAGDHKGLENFLSERLDAHEKFSWMLRATSKTARA
jgi:starvation-inducible DNA-binding protein